MPGIPPPMPIPPIPAAAAAAAPAPSFSSGLSAILVANRICKDTNGKFVLCGLQTNVEKLIEIAQLDRVLSITSNEKEALALI